MATKPLTTEAIALTEKKMDMSLDDIIKMSKTNVGKPKKQRVSNKTRIPTNEKQARALKMRQYMDSRSTLRQGVLAQKRSNFQGNSFPLASDAARKAVAAPFRNGGFNRNKAINWNRPRAAGPMRRQGNASMGSNVHKQLLQQRQQQQRQQPQQRQQQQRQQPQQRQQQQPSHRGEMMPNQKPKTLDSLFANMKEQRLRTFAHTNTGGAVRGTFNQPRQPWLRGRFGNYRN